MPAKQLPAPNSALWMIGLLCWFFSICAAWTALEAGFITNSPSPDWAWAFSAITAGMGVAIIIWGLAARASRRAHPEFAEKPGTGLVELGLSQPQSQISLPSPKAPSARRQGLKAFRIILPTVLLWGLVIALLDGAFGDSVAYYGLALGLVAVILSFWGLALLCSWLWDKIDSRS